MPNLRMTLYDYVKSNFWFSGCEEALKRRGYSLWNKQKGQLIAWSEEELKSVNSDLKFVDALEVGRVPLTPRRFGIRLSSHRLYFNAHNRLDPIAKPEFEILRGSERPGASSPQLLSRITKVGDELCDDGLLIPTDIDPDSCELNSLKYSSAVGKDGCAFDLTWDWDLWKGLRSVKAFSVPDEFMIMLVLDRSQPSQVVERYVAAMLREWLPELGIQYSKDRFRKISLSNALQQIKEKRVADTSNLTGFVFLVPISGQPGDRLPDEQREFLHLLDKLQVQYRVFSFDNTEPKWSARSQALSIIQGAGGIPYRLLLPLSSQAEDCLIYGVDIGHDHLRERVSRLVVSVTDKYGLHVGSFWLRQRLNEAAASGVLVKMLRKAQAYAQSNIDYSAKGSIVLRDGLIPEKRQGSGAESVNTYFQALGPETTVVECRKRGNPEMYFDNEGRLAPVPAGVACNPTDSDVRFICTHDSLFGLPNIFKLRMPAEGDGLAIGLNSMADMITGLCYSPSLGLRPHLPAPIYWADGIGKTGAHNYKFAGQRAFSFVE